MSVLHKQRQIGRLAQVGYPAGFLDGSSSKLGLHEVGVMRVLGGLLDRLCVGQGGGGHAIMTWCLRLMAREIIASGTGAVDNGRICMDRISAVTAAPNCRQSCRFCGMTDEDSLTCPNPLLWPEPSSVWALGSCTRCRMPRNCCTARLDWRRRIVPVMPGQLSCGGDEADTRWTAAYFASVAGLHRSQLYRI